MATEQEANIIALPYDPPAESPDAEYDLCCAPAACWSTGTRHHDPPRPRAASGRAGRGGLHEPEDAEKRGSNAAWPAGGEPAGEIVLRVETMGRNRMPRA